MARGSTSSRVREFEMVDRTMAAALTDYANRLVVESTRRPLQRREWLTAFLGRDFFGPDEKPLLSQQTAAAMKIRYAVGEPMMYHNAGALFEHGPYLVVPPEDYDSERPDSFFKFRIERLGATFLGKITCDTMRPWALSDIDTGVPFLRQDASLLDVSRLANSLICETTSHISEGNTQSGYVVGLPAIREIADENLDLNAYGLRRAEEFTTEIRSYMASTTTPVEH